MQINQRNPALICILFIGFLLRIWGINFGLPYQFHQDEPIVVNHALAYGSGDLNPHFFAIPPFTSYILFFIYGIYFLIGKLLGVFLNPDSFALSFLKNPSMFYLLGRFFIGVIPGTLCIAAIYKLYRKIFVSIEGALFCAAVVAFSFLNVTGSHYIYPDMLMSLLIIFSLCQLIKMYNLPSLKNYIFSGVLIGLAMAIKYNSAIISTTFLIVHIIVSFAGNKKFVNIKLMYAAAAALVTFFLTNPFALFDFKFFINAVLKQGGSESYIGWWHHLNYSLRQSIGLPLLIIGCLGLLLILIKHRLKGLFLLSFPIFFYLHLVFFSQPFPRYILPLIPFFALGSSWFIFECLLPAIKIRFLKKATLIFAFLLFIPLINKSVKADLLFASVDTRIESAKWIEINLSSADKIALDHTFFRPAISQNKEQLTNKSQLIGKQQGLGKLKSRKLKLTLQAQRQEFGYYVYFLNNHPEAQGQFFSTTPALAFDINELIKNGIEYVAINYADRQTASEDFYTDLKNNAELVSFFSPYSDGAIRFSYDTVATTCMPHLSREIYSRIKSGPALEIYKLKK